MQDESGSESGSVKVKRRIRILVTAFMLMIPMLWTLYSKHVNVDSNSQKIELYH